ncbi:related to nif-specific regulatory protein [Cephalotrichum gorgonifer]|uniref:Related to nif-specific regulatory protein n=1 Tax=Cephalotrichum gorgonifer TaxID=2041049 RepID=A0AAE8N345_9PEZI|nr:related to nif-specific regulatory protein [Cephalotrichum gorgonifer]
MATTDSGATASLQAASSRRGEPLAQSKRDKKRQLLNDRISALVEKFDRDKDMAYRDQLQKIQVDTRLVQRIDPFSDDAPGLIAELREEHRNIPGQTILSENARSLLDMAGPKFQDWAQAVADLHERKDYQLTRQHYEYDRKRQEYKNTYNYKIETAKREHHALTSTLRDRLINSLAAKKNRLNKEKEALELSDSPALLFHPNQFSITNPGSPGGAHGKRATRLRKDPEDLGLDNKKRKRNDDDVSPGPGRRGLDSTGTTPLWQSEKLRVAARQSGPIYSIDKLFTDKELTLTYNTAATAAHNYILRHRGSENADSPDGSDWGDSGENDDSESAAMMERQPSHATRSTRGAANQNVIDHKILGFEAISDFELPSNLEKLQALDAPKITAIPPALYLKPPSRTADHNTPSSLPSDTIGSDIQIMSYFRQFDQQYKTGSSLNLNPSLRKALEAAASPKSDGRFVGYVGGPRQDPEEVRRDLGLPPSSSVENPSPDKHLSVLNHGGAAAAVAMSRQSSQGGVAMSRQGTNGSGRGKGRKN